MVDEHVVGRYAVDAFCLDPGQQLGRVAIDNLLGEADELDMLAAVEEGNLAVESMEGMPGCMLESFEREMVVGRAGEELEAYAALATDIEQDQHEPTEQENVGEVA